MQPRRLICRPYQRLAHPATRWSRAPSRVRLWEPLRRHLRADIGRLAEVHGQLTSPSQAATTHLGSPQSDMVPSPEPQSDRLSFITIDSHRPPPLDSSPARSHSSPDSPTHCLPRDSPSQYGRPYSRFLTTPPGWFQATLKRR